MDRSRLIEIARAEMGDSDTHRNRERGYVLHHGLRVARIAADLAEEVGPAGPEAPNADRVFAAGLFHDMCKGAEPHHELAAERAPGLLADVLGEADRRRVAGLVASHNDRGRPAAHTLEAKIVQDADVLDHVGAVNAWMTLQHAARNEQSPEEVIRYVFGPDHQAHRRRLRGLLNLDVSRRRFDERDAREMAFWRRLASENFLEVPAP